jgi:hypothetical protein
MGEDLDTSGDESLTTAAAIHNDAPTDEDELGRHHLVGALERVVRSAETPLVIAVYGSWGSGKTSLMKQLQKRMVDTDVPSNSYDPIRTVWFDPWMHQFDESPALGMLHAAVDQLEQKTVIADARSALLSLAYAMTMNVQIPFTGLKVGNLDTARREMAKDDFDRREARARLREHFQKVFTAAGVSTDSRVVFFIDDLDRCKPAVALSLLESLKLYLDIPGCVFVLGIDREPVEAAVASEYAALGLRAESYLDKIIQVPVALPAIDREQMDRFIQRRLPKDLHSCAEILGAAATNEPRSVKRLTNTLLLNHELAKDARFENGFVPQILAMVVVIQNEAPELYRQLLLDPELIDEVFEGRPDPDGAKAQADQGNEAGEDLWAEFVKPNARLAAALGLVEFPDDLDITPYLTLTTTIAPPMAAAVATADRSRGTVLISAREGDAAAVASLRDPLIERGWVFSEPDRRLLDVPGRREALRAVVVECDSVLIVVGPQWFEQSKPGGPLWNPDDSVRATLELAIETGTPAISVVIGNVPAFEYKHVPDELRPIKDFPEVTMYGGVTRRGIAKVDRRLARIRERRARQTAETELEAEALARR